MLKHETEVGTTAATGTSHVLPYLTYPLLPLPRRWFVFVSSLKRSYRKMKAQVLLIFQLCLLSLKLPVRFLKFSVCCSSTFSEHTGCKCRRTKRWRKTRSKNVKTSILIPA